MNSEKKAAGGRRFYLDKSLHYIAGIYKD